MGDVFLIILPFMAPFSLSILYLYGKHHLSDADEPAITKYSQKLLRKLLISFKSSFANESAHFTFPNWHLL